MSPRAHVSHHQSGQYHLPSHALRFLKSALAYPADRTFILVDAVGSRPGELMDPKGIAIDTSRNLVVVDSGNHRVQVCQCPC